MDQGIADTLNRLTADRIAKHLDLTDWLTGVRKGDRSTGTPWHLSNMATAFISQDTGNAHRAWLLGALAVKTPDVDFDAIPADCDWDNLFQHIRAEITTRRDPKTPHGQLTEDQLAGVV